MDHPETSYVFLALLLGLAVVFCLALLGLARIWAIAFAPAKPGPSKQAPYECSVESRGDAWIQFRSQYYLYALIFLIFDVETLLLLPFAAAFPGLGVGAFVAIMLFLLLLVEGLVWAWRKGLLRWT